MEKLALVNGIKDQAGVYEAPDKTKFTNPDSLNALATDDNPKAVKPSGTYAGEQFAKGQLFVGHFDTDANQFVGDLVPVPQFTMPGDATPNGVKVNDGTVSAD